MDATGFLETRCYWVWSGGVDATGARGGLSCGARLACVDVPMAVMRDIIA